MPDRNVDWAQAKLARVWELNKDELAWEPNENKIEGEIREGIYLHHWLNPNPESSFLLYSPQIYGCLECCPSDGILEMGSPWDEEFARFCEQWLPIFRRGCWLSGCPVEATAHEKMEWAQDFTRGELEVWNLSL